MPLQNNNKLLEAPQDDKEVLNVLIADYLMADTGKNAKDVRLVINHSMTFLSTLPVVFIRFLLRGIIDKEAADEALIESILNVAQVAALIQDPEEMENKLIPEVPFMKQLFIHSVVNCYTANGASEHSTLRHSIDSLTTSIPWNQSHFPISEWSNELLNVEKRFKSSSEIVKHVRKKYCIDGIEDQIREYAMKAFQSLPVPYILKHINQGHIDLLDVQRHYKGEFGRKSVRDIAQVNAELQDAVANLGTATRGPTIELEDDELPEEEEAEPAEAQKALPASELIGGSAVKSRKRVAKTWGSEEDNMAAEAAEEGQRPLETAAATAAVRAYTRDAHRQMNGLRARHGVAWTEEQEQELIRLHQVWGDAWAKIKQADETEGNLLYNKDQVQIKDKWRNIIKSGKRQRTGVPVTLTLQPAKFR